MGAMMPGGQTYDQDSFQLHADDGSESGSTIISTNTNWNQTELDANVRLRILVQHTAVTTNYEDFQLRYSLNLGPILPVNATSLVIRPSLSGEFVEGTNTTQRLGSGAYVADPNDGMDEVDGAAGWPWITFVGLEEVELEFCFHVRSVDVVHNDQVTFWLYRSSDAFTLETYTRVPMLTVKIGALIDPIGRGVIPFVR